MLKKYLKKLFLLFRKKENVIIPSIREEEDLSDILFKVSFMFPGYISYYSGINMEGIRRPDYLGEITLSRYIRKVKYLRLLIMIFSFRTILVWKINKKNIFLNFLMRLPNVFNIDRKMNQKEGWAYFNAYNYSLSNEDLNFVAQAKKRSREYVMNLEEKEYCYIFGTGESLEKAYNFNFDGSYKIACNSMIKNQKLMNYIKPDILVLADAIFHFGPSLYAFRLRESLGTFLDKFRKCRVFIPALFYHHLHTCLTVNKNRIYPISFSKDKKINLNLKKDFCLHPFENVLNIMLLPLASTFSNTVFMLGFDGRKSGDSKFWSYSKKNNFNESLIEQEKAHPGFFNNRKYENYVNFIASQTEKIIGFGEKLGKKYYCLADSNNPALKKRIYP